MECIGHRRHFLPDIAPKYRHLTFKKLLTLSLTLILTLTLIITRVLTIKISKYFYVYVDMHDEIFKLKMFINFRKFWKKKIQSRFFISDEINDFSYRL